MKDFEIKNNLVIDRIDGYSYKLTSKIDADHLCKRLTQQQKTITELQKLQQQSKETEQILKASIQHIKATFIRWTANASTICLLYQRSSMECIMVLFKCHALLNPAAFGI